RAIMDRLDNVVGVENWQDRYQLLPDNSVMCQLRIRIGERWITKADVGGPSEQPDGGDRMKAAFSDALKRAAVKFGIGRYLYRLPNQWCDYDPHRRQFVQTPTLPAWAQTQGDSGTPEAPAREPAANGEAAPTRGHANGKLSSHSLPKDGAELERRLADYDARLASQGLSEPGELVQHVVQAGVKAGCDPDLAN